MSVEKNINKICLRCRNSCKQSAASRIIFCPMFEAKENDLKHETAKGNKDVSAARSNATRLTHVRNST